MTEFFDTHAHLDFPDYAEDLEAVVQRATAAGITRIVTIGTTLEGSARAVAIAERFPLVFAAVGVHPGHMDESPDEIRPALRDLARHPKVVAIGETGLDFFRRPGEPEPEPVADAANRRKQASLFEQQLKVAAELGLNVIIHTRDSFAPTLEVFRPYAARVRGVFHCWVGSVPELREVEALGSLASFTGSADSDVVGFAPGGGYRLGAVIDETRAEMGDDYWPYGLDKNYATLETFLRYHYEQGLSKRLLKPEELFAPETLEAFKI
jgi:TatD DNase family protein